jgi:hypothetical protein
MKGKQKLVNAHILLQCADSNHDGMCVELRDSLLEKFGDVEEATTIHQTMGEGDFCVSAIATIDPSKSELFEKALRELQANSKPRSKVEDVRVYLEVN